VNRRGPTNRQTQRYALSLDSPDVDRKVNLGTAAADCQPKHTKQQDEAAAAAAVEVALLKDDPEELQDDHTHAMKHGRSSSAEIAAEGDHRGKRQHLSASEKQKKLSYIQMARLGYQELVNAIIRPPRADYKVCGCIMVKYETCCSNNYVGSLTHTFILHPPRPLYLQEEMLGPPAFSFCGKRFTRTDFTLMTKRGLNLQCSHWEPVERTSDRIPVVIYMHGNSSARVEVLPQLSYLLSLGLAVFAFDFAGSGKSDGEYVSLGYYEREDLMCVIAHLRATNVVSTIALWGRSMGAATALMHGDRDPSIACMILDSPFSDLTRLAEEMVEKGREQGILVPNIIVSVALRMIQSSVKKQANFNIKHISPIAHADKCFIPALFVAGEHDDFIDKSHSEAIHSKYAGDKNLIVVEGDHNSPRPKFMFDSVSIFLQTCLQIPNSWALPGELLRVCLLVDSMVLVFLHLCVASRCFFSCSAPWDESHGASVVLSNDVSNRSSLNSCVEASISC
jgi:pimeloyl-ACP methyl ester carboxylesterase